MADELSHFPERPLVGNELDVARLLRPRDSVRDKVAEQHVGDWRLPDPGIVRADFLFVLLGFVGKHGHQVRRALPDRVPNAGQAATNFFPGPVAGVPQVGPEQPPVTGEAWIERRLRAGVPGPHGQLVDVLRTGPDSSEQDPRCGHPARAARPVQVEDYLTCGGFPRAVAEHTRMGAVSTAYLNDLKSWLRADVDPDRPQDSVPRLLNGISQRATSPLNITATSSALGYPSRDIFVRRLNRLVSSHAALWCPRRDEDEQIVSGAQAKLYLTDPLLAALPSRLRAGLPGPDMTRLTEMTLAVALARTIDDLEEGRWVSGDTIGYVRTSGDNEVDLGPVSVPSANGPVTTVPLESKWVEKGWRGESRTIDAKFGRGILATKSILDTTGNVWAVPAPLLALLLQ